MHENLMYGYIGKEVKTSPFSIEELAKLSEIKPKYRLDGSHDADPKEDIADFRLEKAHLFDDISFWNHLVTYLYEYRFQVQETTITQTYSDGHIRDHTGKPMVKMGEDAIGDCNERDQITYKVDSDKICLQKLDSLAKSAKEGDTLVYASPPDPVMGYTYGFLYVGNVGKPSNNDKEIKLRCIRLNNASLPEYNSIISLLGNQEISFNSPNEFLENPLLVQTNITTAEIYSVLKPICNVEYNVQEKEKYKDIISIISPRINQFIQTVKDGATLEERIEGRHSLEIYALQIKKEYEKAEEINMLSVWKNHIIPQYNKQDYGGFVQVNSKKELPKVSGSCPGIKNRRSSNLYGSPFDSYNVLDEAMDILDELGFGEEDEDQYGSLKFYCLEKPKGCAQELTRPRGKLLKHCYKCGVDISCGKKLAEDFSTGENAIPKVVFDRNSFQGKKKSQNKRSFVLNVKRNKDSIDSTFSIKIQTKSKKQMQEEYKRDFVNI